MTAVMILFAFALSLVVGYIEREIHHDNPYARRHHRKDKKMEPNPAHKPE